MTGQNLSHQISMLTLAEYHIGFLIDFVPVDEENMTSGVWLSLEADHPLSFFSSLFWLFPHPDSESSKARQLTHSYSNHVTRVGTENLPLAGCSVGQ